MIKEFKDIEQLFLEINQNISKKVDVFMIGGGMLLYHRLKPATKDIDLIVSNEKEFDEFQKALRKIGFNPKTPSLIYKRMNISEIFVRNDFRIDIFNKSVCKGFSLSNSMIKRADSILRMDKLSLSLCSKEDVFLFKTLTEREGDLEDCISLAKRGLDWKAIFEELKHQVKIGKDVWITWVGERLDILEEKGLNIPIKPKIDILRDDYFNELEKRRK